MAWTTGGIDGFTKLLLHCDGTAGATSFVDASLNNHSVSAVADAQVATAQKKFGTGSCLLDGTGDYLSVPDSDDWNFTGDFTIDFWVRFNSLSGDQFFAGQHPNGTPYWTLSKQISTNKIFWQTRDSPGDDVITTTAAFSSTGVWYHVAVVVSNSTMKTYVDGVSQTTTGTYNGSPQASLPLTVGGIGYQENRVNGWLDEFRISKGIARWTANFTPPSAEYYFGGVQDESVAVSDTLSANITGEFVQTLSSKVTISDTLSAAITAIPATSQYSWTLSSGVTVSDAMSAMLTIEFSPTLSSSVTLTDVLTATITVVGPTFDEQLRHGQGLVAGTKYEMTWI